jgi:hypothetical protein
LRVYPSKSGRVEEVSVEFGSGFGSKFWFGSTVNSGLLVSAFGSVVVVLGVVEGGVT